MQNYSSKRRRMQSYEMQEMSISIMLDMQEIIYKYIVYNNIVAQHYKLQLFHWMSEQTILQFYAMEVSNIKQIMPFLLVFILSPIWITLGVIAFLGHFFYGVYFLFQRWDYESAIRRLSKVQFLMVILFVYFIGGIVLYPFVVLYECIMILIFLMSQSLRFIKRIRNV